MWKRLKIDSSRSLGRSTIGFKSVFGELFEFGNVTVKTVDPESALVSKAVKAPAKNKQLIRQAIASNQFDNLVDRILASGGKLEDFI